MLLRYVTCCVTLSVWTRGNTIWTRRHTNIYEDSHSGPQQCQKAQARGTLFLAGRHTKVWMPGGLRPAAPVFSLEVARNLSPPPTVPFQRPTTFRIAILQISAMLWANWWATVDSVLWIPAVLWHRMPTDSHNTTNMQIPAEFPTTLNDPASQDWHVVHCRPPQMWLHGWFCFGKDRFFDLDRVTRCE